MKATPTNWFHNPTKGSLLFMTAIWLIGTVFTTIALTNGFTESLFQSKYLITYFGIFGTACVILKMYIVYFKNKREG